jgi:anti-sigma regulatory factor (Ser/Thr protein kinase)
MEAARRAPHRSAQLAHDYSLFAPADATAPKVCRDFVRAVLLTLDRESLVMPATLCTSELVTNVHLHTKGTAMIRLQLTPARLRVSVYDESRDPPVTPTAGLTACWGPGLALVAEVADVWGVAGERAGRFAKGVWFELGEAEVAGSFRPHRIG